MYTGSYRTYKSVPGKFDSSTTVGQSTIVSQPFALPKDSLSYSCDHIALYKLETPRESSSYYLDIFCYKSSP
jgi:hypothetical protein